MVDVVQDVCFSKRAQLADCRTMAFSLGGEPASRGVKNRFQHDIIIRIDEDRLYSSSPERLLHAQCLNGPILQY